MAKYSQKQNGKEVGQAAVYAEPHTMKGGKVNTKEAISVAKDPNTLAAKDLKPGKPAMRVSMGDPNADDVKTTGIKIRGTGAATKGVMARGPMA
jgi:uncharacterized protein (DUF2141 family)